MTILHSRITGTGRPVVLLGALGSSTDMWVPLQDALVGDPYRLIALDHRGHGTSPMPTGPTVTGGDRSTRISDLADDVLETLDALGAGTVDLVGLSIGGAVAQHIAARVPGRVRTLTLMCTDTTFGDARGWTTRATSVRAGGIDTLRELAESTVTRWLTLPYRESHPGTTLAVADMIARTSPAGYAACCDALSTFNGSELLPDITAPTLTVAGSLDPTCSPATLAAMGHAVPSASGHLVIDGAHLLPVESGQAVADALRTHWSGRQTTSEPRVCGTRRPGR